MNPTGYAIVVDASVARAAGDYAATDPVSVLCRESLSAIQEAGHCVVMSSPIRREWQKHHSHFAWRWLTLMASRRRILRLDDPINHRLRAEIRQMAEPNIVPRVLKDAPLIEAALATDRRILSLNERERRHFQAIARQAAPASESAKLRVILWANPGRPEEDVPRWLRAGAPDESARRLSAAVASHAPP